MAKDGTSKLTKQIITILKNALFFLWPGLGSSLKWCLAPSPSLLVWKYLFLDKFILGISSSFMKSVWRGRDFSHSFSFITSRELQKGSMESHEQGHHIKSFVVLNNFTILFRVWFSMPQTFAYFCSCIISLCSRTPFTSPAIMLSGGVSWRGINSLSSNAKSEFLWGKDANC